MDMTPVTSCSMSSCAYNSGEICHTRAINVGYHAECNTYVHGSTRGGLKEAKGGIGACMASDCKYNDRLECVAGDVDVSGHENHADCGKFCDRASLE